MPNALRRPGSPIVLLSAKPTIRATIARHSTSFSPRNRESWDKGGKAPLLIDPRGEGLNAFAGDRNDQRGFDLGLE
ncbi:MAG: hypothetical protein WA417_10625 [Stellaceae bacterium]